MKAQNIGEAITSYYRKNKKRLMQEAIESNNVQLSNALIKLYEGLGESLDDIFGNAEVVEEIAEKVTTKEEVNLSEIFAKKLR